MMNLCSGWEEKAYPYMHLTPGAEFAPDRRAWQGCPTVVVTKKGRLFAGWYSGGAFEPCIDNYNVLAMSDDGGKTWLDPLLTIGTDEETACAASTSSCGERRIMRCG